jgi:hypothetical protein
MVIKGFQPGCREDFGELGRVAGSAAEVTRPSLIPGAEATEPTENNAALQADITAKLTRLHLVEAIFSKIRLGQAAHRM